MERQVIKSCDDFKRWLIETFRLDEGMINTMPYTELATLIAGTSPHPIRFKVGFDGNDVWSVEYCVSCGNAEFVGNTTYILTRQLAILTAVTEAVNTLSYQQRSEMQIKIVREIEDRRRRYLGIEAMERESLKRAS